MSTTIDITRTHPREGSPASPVVATAAVAGAISSAAFILGFVLLSDQSQREASMSPYTLTVNVVTVLAFSALAVTIPSLARSLDVPRWVTYTCAAACAGVAAFAWSLTTVGSHHASRVSDDEFLEFSTYLTLLPAPKMLLGLVGFTAFGIIGWRRRAVPRVASVLLVLGGLTSLWWAYPPATIFVGIAFALIARSAETSASGTG